MELGNKFAGLTASKDYCSFRLFPLGIELLTNDYYYEMAFILSPIEFSIAVKRNTLFK